MQGVPEEALKCEMSHQRITNERFPREGAVPEKFLDCPNEESFAELFNTFRSQLVSFSGPVAATWPCPKTLRRK